MGPGFQRQLRACGWWTINRDKLQSSAADYWVLVLQGFASRTVDFVIIPPGDLWRRLKSIHGSQKTIQSYLWVTEKAQCWETRGLSRTDQLLIAHGGYSDRLRDLSRWLNNWSPLAKLNA